MAYRTLTLLALSLTACDPADPAEDASIDAGEDAQVSTVPPMLEVGIGEGSFQSFEEGATLTLVCGGQGLQHVWTAVRAWGIDRRGTLIDLSLRRDVDGEIVSQAFHVRVSLQAVPGEDYSETYGLTLIVPEPDRAIGEDLTMRVVVTAMDGTELVVERDVRIQWETPEGCATG